MPAIAISRAWISPPPRRHNLLRFTLKQAPKPCQQTRQCALIGLHNGLSSITHGLRRLRLTP